jgi:hypothetical protein
MTRRQVFLDRSRQTLRRFFAAGLPSRSQQSLTGAPRPKRRVFCCDNCFGDLWLKQQVTRLSITRATCDYCHSKHAAVVPADVLRVYFERLMSIFMKVESGVPIRTATGEGFSAVVEGRWYPASTLIFHLQVTWGVFSWDTLDDERRSALLEAILNSREGAGIIRAAELYIDRRTLVRSYATTWQDFVDQVTDHPTEALPFESSLSTHLERAVMHGRLGRRYYRARRGFNLTSRWPLQGA